MSDTEAAMWHPTDYLLAQLRWAADAPAASLDLNALGTVAHAVAAQVRVPGDGGIRADRLAWSADLRCAYLYFALDHRTVMSGTGRQPLTEALRAALPAAVSVAVSRLERVFEVAGASAGEASTAHYVVEMDPALGWMDEIERWYDEEHMPGLAAVPGCARAQRLLNHDHGPLSLACYDLARKEAFGSPPWLAVRATDWSSRVRPNFTNTKRTMFEWVDI
jgi:hypothetical protein